MDAAPIRRVPGWSRHFREWPLWELPGWLSWFVISVSVVYAAALVVAGTTMRFRPGDVELFAILLGFGVVTTELTRRAGEPAGFRHDLNGIWMLPIAILLPPFYCLALQILNGALLQWRLRRYVIHRRVFNAAVHGMSYGAAAVTFQAISPHLTEVTTNQATLWLLRSAVIAGCAVLRLAVNRPLVMIAVKGSDRTASMRAQLLGKGQIGNDLSELTAGVVLTVLLAATRSWFLVLLALPLITSLQRALQHAQLLNAARIDAKTGLLNAITWQREASIELTRAHRTRTPVALAMVDIDHFKRVNDSYGHLAGDAVLAMLAATMRGVLRDYDVIGRFGGEEFAVLLPHTSAAEAEQAAERLRHKLSQLAVPTGEGPDGVPLRVTVSIGVATLESSRRDLDELIAAADAALYRAKDAGRNCVRLSGDPTTSPG